MQVLNIFHVLVAIAMVALILVQRGPGATAGAAFGSGASGTVFGSRGAGSFLSRATWVLAAAFCVISLSMAVVVARNLAAPEVDLGVVSAQPAADGVSPEDSPMIDDSGTDLPSLDTGPATGGEGAEAGDLPDVEPGPEEQDQAGGTPDG
jgi:preprotein translocase subunit SecG